MISLAVFVSALVEQSGSAGVVFDFANTQWWQWLVATIVALGLSPAPWILGLATGKIQFTHTAERHFEQRVADLVTANDRLLGMQHDFHGAIDREKDRALAEMTGSRDYYREARLEEKRQKDQVVDALVESIEVAHTGTRALDTIARVAEESPR